MTDTTQPSGNNCCKCTLQTGTKITAVIQIVWSAIKIYFSIDLMIIFADAEYVKVSNSTWIILSIVLAVSLLTFALGILLLFAAYKRDLKKVKCWLRICAVLLILDGIFLILSLFGVGSGADKVQEIRSFLVSLYCVAEVYFFKWELDEDPENYLIVA